MAPDGGHAHRICATRARCGAPKRPRWSPDGRALVFSAPSIKIIYSDGSCLDCQIWAGRPAHLRRIGYGSQPSWSPGGTTIAATQRGWIVTVRVRDGRVYRLARGRAPAYSPDGRSIAFVTRASLIDGTDRGVPEWIA